MSRSLVASACAWAASGLNEILNLNLQLQNFDRANTLMDQTIESTIKTTRTQAIKIKGVEKSVQTITSEVSNIKNRLNKKK